MRVAHEALVLVTDGRKMLLLRNKGNPERIDLQLERKEIRENPKDIDQKTDAAGHSSSTQSGAGAPVSAQGGSMQARGQGAQFAPSRGTMGETDYHRLEEEKFAAEVAQLLNRKALSNAFEELVVVAPARTLGELRKHYHKEVDARLAAEIGKDLTSHPVPEIEEVLVRAP